MLEVAKGKASVAVPDLTGQTEQAAVAALARAGLKARVAQCRRRGRAAPSSRRARPRAEGRAGRRGAAERLARPGRRSRRRSSRRRPAHAPRRGGAEDHAGQAAGDRRLRLLEQARRAVVANAAAGARASSSSLVRPESKASASVPDVRGEDGSQAASDLRAAGFDAIAVRWPVSEQSQNGVVTYQTPSAGSRAPQGATVVVYVGSFSG